MTSAQIALLILSLVERLAGAFQKVKQAAEQSGEWSKAQAEDFDARMEAAFKGDHWKTDEEIGGEG